MANRFYLPPMDPGYSRVGEALAQGVARGTQGFLQARQLQEERKEREREQRRREVRERIQQAMTLGQLGGGLGAAPSVRTETDVTSIADTLTDQARQRLTPPGAPTMSVRPRGPALPPAVSERPDDRFMQVVAPSADHPGAYIKRPEVLAREAQAAADREYGRRIEQAMLMTGVQAGVDPAPYIRPDGTLDVGGYGSAIASAMATRRQAPVQAWQVNAARDQAVNALASDLVTRFTSTGGQLLPEHRRAAHYVALGLVRNAGLPDSYVPQVVERAFNVYGRDRVPEGVNLGRVVSEAIRAFSKFLEEDPRGRIHSLRGGVAEGAAEWLRGSGGLTIRALASQYGMDPDALRREFERQLGLGSVGGR